MEFDPHASLGVAAKSLKAFGAVSLAALSCNLAPALARPHKQQAIGVIQTRLEATKTSAEAGVPPGLGEPNGHLEISAEDDLAVVARTQPAANLDQSQAHERLNKLMTIAKQGGATSWRLLIRPSYVDKYGWDDYIYAAKAAEQNGLNYSLTTSCNLPEMTEQGVTSYMTTVATLFKDATDILPCNEPNISQKSLPGLTAACTYERVYDLSQRAIKHTNPDARVLFGGVTAYGDPLGFLDQVYACAAVNDRLPIKADGLAYNPYQFRSTPLDSTPPDGAVGIGSLERIEAKEFDDYKARRLVSSALKVPQIYFNEFNYWVATLGEQSNAKIPADNRLRYIPDSLRAEYFGIILPKLCADPRIARFGVFGLQAKPDWFPAPWSTPLLNRNDEPTETYKTIQEFTVPRPSCIRRHGWQPR